MSRFLGRCRSWTLRVWGVPVPISEGPPGLQISKIWDVDPPSLGVSGSLSPFWGPEPLFWGPMFGGRPVFGGALEGPGPFISQGCHILGVPRFWGWPCCFWGCSGCFGAVLGPLRGQSWYMRSRQAVIAAMYRSHSAWCLRDRGDRALGGPSSLGEPPVGLSNHPQPRFGRVFGSP